MSGGEAENPDLPTRAVAWALARVGARARLDGWSRLFGGTACAIHALDVVDARGVRHALVLKRFVRADWVAREPDVAVREAANLERVAGIALPTPRGVAVDPDGSAVGEPAVLMERLRGRSEVQPADEGAWLEALARVLAELHDLPRDEAARFPAYRSYRDPAALAVPSWTRHAQAWERAFERLQAAPPDFTAGFVHRDYHPNNLLFLQGRVSGVLDFTDSSCGPAGVDLGHCCGNLVQLRGVECAERFVGVYRAAGGRDDALHPFWALRSVADGQPGPDVVYPGWTRLGVRGLSVELVRERIDDWVARRVSEL